MILRQVVSPAAGHRSLLGTGQLVVVLPGPVRHQVGVVGGSGVGDGSRAARVQVAEVVREHLKIKQVIPDSLRSHVNEFSGINQNRRWFLRKESKSAYYITHLQFVCRKAAVVPQDLVVAGSASPLDPLVAEEVEVALGRMVDALVHHGPRQSVAVPVLVVIGGEKPGDE